MRSILMGFGMGFGVFLLGTLSDVWLRWHGGTLAVAVMDDALVGVAASLLVYLYERQRNRTMARKLEVIRLMNHHVRNSLQVISFAVSVPQREELTHKVQDAVERIEWALREVLPGQREDIDDLAFHPKTNVSPAERSKMVS
jgi:light-regulated signal transduction histidine kinase (bacteriophytochrome)